MNCALLDCFDWFPQLTLHNFFRFGARTKTTKMQYYYLRIKLQYLMLRKFPRKLARLGNPWRAPRKNNNVWHPVARRHGRVGPLFAVDSDTMAFSRNCVCHNLFI